MIKNIICPIYKARLQLISSNSQSQHNWLFLPGGPGLGSESLNPLTQALNLPGSIWHFDFPGDGSNLTENDNYYFQYWHDALIEAVKEFKHVILVGHSTGGMYILATPALKQLICGLILMDSAPNILWQKSFAKYVQDNPLPTVKSLKNSYGNNKNNEFLKETTIKGLPYIFTAEGLKKDLSFFYDLPYNFKSYAYSAQHFDKTYCVQWIPENIPTLIFAGDQDHLTPISYFEQMPVFHHQNIMMRIIDHAGHFPWIENLAQVQDLFKVYAYDFLIL